MEKEEMIKFWKSSSSASVSGNFWRILQYCTRYGSFRCILEVIRVQTPDPDRNRLGGGLRLSIVLLSFIVNGGDFNYYADNVYSDIPHASCMGGTAAGATGAMAPPKFWLGVHNAFGPPNNCPVHSLIVAL